VRLLRNLLLALFAVVAVIGGMLFVVALAIVGTLATAFARLLRPAPAARSSAPPGGNEVIDVAATEVKSPHLLR